MVVVNERNHSDSIPPGSLERELGQLAEMAHLDMCRATIQAPHVKSEKTTGCQVQAELLFRFIQAVDEMNKTAEQKGTSSVAYRHFRAKAEAAHDRLTQHKTEHGCAPVNLVT